MPLGIIISEDMIFTVCLEETPVLGMLYGWEESGAFLPIRRRALSCRSFTGMPACTCVTSVFIDKKSESGGAETSRFTRRIRSSSSFWRCRNLWYISPPPSGSNEVVLEKLLKVESIKKYPEDTDLLEDVITENKQAIEMAHVYSGYPQQHDGHLLRRSFPIMSMAL